MPIISCMNVTTTPLAQPFEKIVAVLQEAVDKHFAPAWGTPCKLVVTAGRTIPPGNWALAWFDDADQANALGYHELTKGGMPIGKNFVRTTIQAGEDPSVTASHELFEMLVDPAIADGTLSPQGVWYAKEVCDAVEAFSFLVQGVKISNFQYPAWFEAFRKPNSKLDHLGMCTKPFQLLRGGYMPVFKNGRWSQIFGRGGECRYKALHSHPRGECRKNLHNRR